MIELTTLFKFLAAVVIPSFLAWIGYRKLMNSIDDRILHKEEAKEEKRKSQRILELSAQTEFQQQLMGQNKEYMTQINAMHELILKQDDKLKELITELDKYRQQKERLEEELTFAYKRIEALEKMQKMQP